MAGSRYFVPSYTKQTWADGKKNRVKARLTICFRQLILGPFPEAFHSFDTRHSLFDIRHSNFPAANLQGMSGISGFN